MDHSLVAGSEPLSAPLYAYSFRKSMRRYISDASFNIIGGYIADLSIQMVGATQGFRNSINEKGRYDVETAILGQPRSRRNINDNAKSTVISCRRTRSPYRAKP